MSRLKILLICMMMPIISWSAERDGVIYGSIGYKNFGDHGLYNYGIGVRASAVGMGVEFSPSTLKKYKAVYASVYVPWRWFAISGSFGQVLESNYSLDDNGKMGSIFGVGFQIYISADLMLGYQYRIDRTYNFSILQIGARF